MVIQFILFFMSLPNNACHHLRTTPASFLKKHSSFKRHISSQPSASRQYHSLQEKCQPLLPVDCSWLAGCAQKIENTNKADPSKLQHLTLTPGSTADKHNENTQHKRLVGIYAIDAPQKGLRIQTL